MHNSFKWTGFKTKAIDQEGNIVMVNPRGFYLRKSFTKEVKLTFLGLRAVLAVTDCSSLVKQRIICVFEVVKKFSITKFLSYFLKMHATYCSPLIFPYVASKVFFICSDI